MYQRKDGSLPDKSSHRMLKQFRISKNILGHQLKKKYLQPMYSLLVLYSTISIMLTLEF
jgi:hypothetical protein